MLDWSNFNAVLYVDNAKNNASVNDTEGLFQCDWFDHFIP